MEKPNSNKGFNRFIRRGNGHRPDSVISEVVREPTAGGVVYREKDGKIEMLLIQDSRNRWTIPKGHIEKGETAKQTAAREVREETGLKDVVVKGYLGKIHFRYRRVNTLVLMTTHIYLVKAEGDTEDFLKEDWMNGIRWMPAQEAFDIIAYEAIGKLILLGVSQIKNNKFNS